MSIPIKAQARVDHGGHECILILKDGSIYGIDYTGEVIELSRSYAGGVIREAMKRELTQYHEMMRVANLTEKQGDLVDAYNMRKAAVFHLKKHDAAEKLFDAFKSLTKSKDTHATRYDWWFEHSPLAPHVRPANELSAIGYESIKIANKGNIFQTYLDEFYGKVMDPVDEDVDRYGRHGISRRPYNEIDGIPLNTVPPLNGPGPGNSNYADFPRDYVIGDNGELLVTPPEAQDEVRDIQPLPEEYPRTKATKKSGRILALKLNKEKKRIYRF